MNQFTIEPNQFLNISIKSFYHSDYFGGGDRWRIGGTIENVICTLKNDITPFPETVLQIAVQNLSKILSNDLPEIQRLTRLNNLTVCVVPRAKVNYNPNQLLFKSTIHNVVNQLGIFNNGIDFITRHKDTRTTHRDRVGFGGNGDLPYPGITKDTCNISTVVRNSNILLIDDLYTKTVNVDEDAIQALLDAGANSVTFYAIGKNVYR